MLNDYYFFEDKKSYFIFCLRRFFCTDFLKIVALLVVTDCSFKDANEYPVNRSEKMSQGQGNTTKVMAEASWYGAKFQGEALANSDTYELQETDRRP